MPKATRLHRVGSAGPALHKVENASILQALFPPARVSLGTAAGSSASVTTGFTSCTAPVQSSSTSTAWVLSSSSTWLLPGCHVTAPLPAVKMYLYSTETLQQHRVRSTAHAACGLCRRTHRSTQQRQHPHQHSIGSRPSPGGQLGLASPNIPLTPLQLNWGRCVPSGEGSNNS